LKFNSFIAVNIINLTVNIKIKENELINIIVLSSYSFYIENMEKKAGNISKIYKPEAETKVSLPLFSEKLSAGFPSPANDYIDRGLDLNELLIQNPSATFYVEIEGESMINAGINSGDILVVDRSLEAKHGTIIVAILDGEFTVKKLYWRGKVVKLVAENPNYKPIEITDEMDFEIWGVATTVIHRLNK
jgi:DNA polymerase V